MTINKSKLIDAVLENNGLLELAAKQLGCSLSTIYNHRDRDEDVAKAIVEARETFDCEILDLAESKLLNAVKENEAWAIKYVLSTKGKIRGYTEKKELEHNGGVKQIIMQMDIAADDDADDDFDEV